MSKIRVFLVDDHPVAREGTRRLLGVDGEIAVVGEADSAEEMLKQVEFCTPEVVLMDVQLPGISGIEATRQLKEGHPEVRVVILSAFGHEYLSQAIEAGADGYVLKTASQTELSGAVKQVAGGGSPIDRELMGKLLGQFTELAKRSQSQGLKQRQLTILQGIAQGVPSKKLCAQLAISDATFKRDIRSVFDYLGVDDRAQAVAEAYKRKLL